MPTVLLINGYRFSFFASDGAEPRHVHVSKADASAKIWLEPVRIDYSLGFTSAQLRFIRKTIDENKAYIIAQWNDFFGL